MLRLDAHLEHGQPIHIHLRGVKSLKNIMSSDSEESDDSHFWSRPSSPHETFDNLEGADANGEWQSRHIGHQVDYRGEIMYMPIICPKVFTC